MNVPDAAIDLIRRYEGLRLEAYRCPAGVWTIGYGTTRGVTQGMQITVEQAEEFLLRDVREVAARLRPLIDVELTDNQFGALVSFAYNLGVEAFEHSTLRHLVNTRAFPAVPNQLLLWCKADIGGVKRVLPGLVARREAEGKLWTS